jgi:UDP-glucose 4-epimerase
VRIVITGGAGFIGANLARLLAEANPAVEIVIVDDLSSGSWDNLGSVPAVRWEGSVLDPGLLDDALRGADGVVHLAAVASVPRSLEEPLHTHAVNVTGTLQVLEAVRRAGGPHVIVASSSAVYGANPRLPTAETLRPEPLSPYAVSKLATETYALAYAACYGLDVLAFRFFNVFGPLQPAGHVYAAVVPAFLDAALAGRPLPVFGDGTQTRDFTFVGTVCRVLADALHRRVSSPDPVNLADGTRTSLLELIGLLAEVLGRPVQVDLLPVRPGDVPHSQADVDRLRSLFPDVAPIPLREGLATTAAWFRSRTRGGQPAG